MKAIHCVPPSIACRESPVPDEQPGESIVNVSMAGICRTDLEITRGYMGYEGILGHEFVGVVASSSTHTKGTRVVGEINAGCGTCSWCRASMQRHCPHRSVLGILKRGGCMAECLSLPDENLLPVPEGVADEEAVFTEPLAAALEIYEQIPIPPDARVCVIGDGKLGLLITMTIAHRQEIPPTLVGRHTDKLQLVQDMAETRLEDECDSSMNQAWDVVVDATGSSSGLNHAMSWVRPLGTIVLKSTMAQTEALDLTPLVINEITLVGSRCGQFAPALSLLNKNVIPVDRLIERIYDFDEAQRAWDHATTRGSKKILLRISHA